MLKISKWLLSIVASLLVFASIAVIVITSFIDPNDYKKDIEAVANKNSIRLSIEGDITWQFFPRLGIAIEQVSFADDYFHSGSVGQMIVTADWLLLLNGKIDLANIPVDSVTISQGTFRYANPDLLPIQLDDVALSVDNFSLSGSDFDFSASAEVLNGLPLAINTTLAIKVKDQKITHVKATDLRLQADQIIVTGNVDADLEALEIVGNLSSPSINVMNQIKTIQQRLPIFSIPTMSNANALTDVRFNSEFSVNPWGYSNYVHEIFIDQQRFDATIEADQSTGKMNALISGDQFKLSDYLPEGGSSTNPANSGAIFAPLALPFIFWQGQSQIELTINEIVLDTFSLSNLYGNLSGLDNFLQLTSFNADLLGGQLNATARVDLRDRSPSFSLQTSIDSVDLNKAFSALADLTDVSGQLTGNITMSGTGQDITEIQQSLSGSGRFTVLDPSYEAMNLEQTVCQAATLMGGSSSNLSALPTGTNLETLTSNLSISNGRISVNDITTALGNLNLAGKGYVQMLEQRYRFDVNALIAGSKTSSLGCSINKRLQNRTIPFICTGRFDGDTSKPPSCVPNQSATKDLLKNTLIEKIGEKYLGNTSALKNIFGKQ